MTATGDGVNFKKSASTTAPSAPNPSSTLEPSKFDSRLKSRNLREQSPRMEDDPVDDSERLAYNVRLKRFESFKSLECNSSCYFLNLYLYIYNI